MRCTACNGEGTITREAMTLDGIRYPAVRLVPCEECDETGRVCEWCYEPHCRGECDEAMEAETP